VNSGVPRSEIFALLILAFMPGAAHAQESQTLQTCAPDAQIMLLQDYGTFDQTERGWRRVDRPGCEAAAADLIARYRVLQAALLAAPEAQILRWHEGQIRAALGQDAAALALFVTTHDEEHPESPWNAYVDATIAFLKHDHEALVAARDRLAAPPPAPGFDAVAADFLQRTGRTLRWPPNLDVVEGLIACFDRPYREAYAGAACRS